MSPWEQKAETLGVNYQPWTPPNYGETDRAHFNFQQFSHDEQVLHEEVEALRRQVGVEPYQPSAKPVQTEQAPAEVSPRQERMDKAAAFLSTIDELAQPS